MNENTASFASARVRKERRSISSHSRVAETFAQRVIVAVACRTHGWAHAGFLAALPEGERGVLLTIRMMDY